MIFDRIIQRTVTAIILLFPLSALAHIIGITPITPFPSVISVFSPPVKANFHVVNLSANANFTAVDKSQFPKGSGLSISSNSCGNVLTPGQACTIQLTLNTTSPMTISTYLREWAKPTADGMQYPINLQVTSTMSGLLFASAANGNVYVSANQGAGWTATTLPPNNGTAVHCVSATNVNLYACSGSTLYYTANGKSWAATTSPDGSLIDSLYITSMGKLFVGTENGNLLISNNNGLTWATTNQPDGSAVNSIYVTAAGDIYAGTANGSVEYSSDNGTTWTAIDGQPDGSAITSVYVANGTLYVSTVNQYAYTSNSLTGGGSWTYYAQSVYSLFVNASGSVIDASTQTGYVYSLITAAKLGFVANSPITGVFQLS